MNPDMTRRNIILVGFMASGKSVVGEALSRLAGMPLVDADEEIARRAGRPIRQIFEKDGEAAFRELERAVIADLCAGVGRVIAAGGGAFVDPDNRDAMLASGVVFCLSARPETILERLSQEPGDGVEATGADGRPMLAGDDVKSRVESLMAQRGDAYDRAHHTIETDELTPELAARRILELCPAMTAVKGD